MTSIFDKIKNHFTNKLPFVVYSKPSSELVSGFFMKDDFVYKTKNFTESGFVFAPFNSEKEAILFPEEKTIFFNEKFSSNKQFIYKNEFKFNDTSEDIHTKIVEKAIDIISENELKKVVVSRKELQEIDDFDIIEIYQKLLQTYKNAYVYVWFHPKVGLWFGATPETLLQIENNTFKTMSLAGTQLFVEKEKPIWKNKELDEQQLVTDFISSQLQNIATHLEIDKTETIRAGNLLHLRTKVNGKLNIENYKLKTLIRALHPTPAVCGLPRKMAEEFINKNENYDREFYTGFLGEINIQNSELNTVTSNLFVNLRCMKVEDNAASIYIGGGITKDSNAKKEWKETVSKSKTMKRVL